MPSSPWRYACAFAVVALLPPASSPHRIGSPRLAPSAVERLAALAELYGAVAYFHPYLAHRRIDWDSAVAAAVPAAGRATGASDYAAVVRRLLQALGDPATRLVRGPGAAPQTAAPSRTTRLARMRWTSDSVLLVTVAAPNAAQSGSGAPATLDELRRAIEGARRVVFDLRGADHGAVVRLFDSAGVASRLSAVALPSPRQRSRLYSGMPPARGQTSGGYSVRWTDVDPPVAPGVTPAPGATDKDVAFIADTGAALPVVAVALQHGGRGAIVAEGGVSDAALVRTYVVRLADGLEAAVRTSEIVNPDGSIGARGDTTLPVPTARGESDESLRAALAWLDRVARARARGPDRPAAPEPPASESSGSSLGDSSRRSAASAPYPDVGYRVVAAYRIWSTIRYFFPYKQLMREDWDAVLRRSIPELQAAADSLAYVLAVARMCTRIHDSHVNVISPTMRRYLGEAGPPVRVRMIEGVPVVTDVYGDSLALAGLAVGDVILSVDAEPAAVRYQRLAELIPASTPQALAAVATRRLLNGSDGVDVRLVVRGAAGPPREVRLPRRASYLEIGLKERRGQVLRDMPGNVGYADLDRLPTWMVDSMFERFRNAKAIVFDMRGYPNGTAWWIAPRLTSLRGVVAAKFRRPQLQSPDTAEATAVTFDQTLPVSDKWKYTGKTVMLIGERTISQAEHTGLFLEAANGTQFVGSPSMGANGDVTNFAVPGGILITFTGHDVRHADGRQLQRVGLVPHLEVRPTIAGVRAGRDEVLERALRSVGGTGEIPPDTPAVLGGGVPSRELPAGWSITGSAPQDYALGVDRTVRHDGAASARLRSLEPLPRGFATLVQSVRADEYQGTRVGLSAYLRASDVRGSAQLWMRVDGEGTVLAFDNMADRPVTGSTDWVRREVVLDVPRQSAGIAFGMLLTGPGEVWVDEVRLEVVGTDVRSTNTAPPGTPNAAIARQQAERYAGVRTRPINLDFESGTAP